jgi:hypothetical protein
MAIGVDGDRHFDAQGIDGLHDRRRHGSDRDRDRALLLPAISDDRFHDDIRGVLAGGNDCDRMDIAEAVPAYIIAGALVPVLVVGAVLHWRRYRSGESWRTSAYDRAARRSNPSSRSLPGGAHEKDDPSPARADAAS